MDSELRKLADKMARLIDNVINGQQKELSLNLEMLRLVKEEYVFASTQIKAPQTMSVETLHM
jgi:hypothetical protein